MKSDTIDINERYFEIFGQDKRTALFAEDDEEYAALRQTIIDAPKEKYDKSKLPFDGFRIPSKYEISFIDDLLVPVIIPNLSKIHIFYLKQFNADHGLDVNVAAYYDVESKKMIVLHHSYFREPEKTNSQDALPILIADYRSNFISATCKMNNDGYYVVKDKNYKTHSPFYLACYVLGKVASWELWKDKDGKGLQEVYPNETFTNVFNMISTPKTQKLTFCSPFEAEVHAFVLKSKKLFFTIYDAKGHFDLIHKKFILEKGSHLAYDLTIFSEGSRVEWIRKNCTIKNRSVILNDDVAFDSSKEAGIIVTGEEGNWDEVWVDNNGKHISDFDLEYNN